MTKTQFWFISSILRYAYNLEEAQVTQESKFNDFEINGDLSLLSFLNTEHILA